MNYFFYDFAKRCFDSSFAYLNFYDKILDVLPSRFKNKSFSYDAFNAWIKTTGRFLKDYDKPEFVFENIIVDGKSCSVAKSTKKSLPFCNLINFDLFDVKTSKPLRKARKKLVIIPPLSGHYPTLLKDTVSYFLPFYDIFVCEWQNARDVPLEQGDFDLDNYIDYLIEFNRHLEGDVYFMAVCQPCIPLLAMSAYLSAEKHEKLPKGIMLLSGPIDVSINSTMVNTYADSKQLQWFVDNVIDYVPAGFAGAGRSVYPGYLQLSAFLSMNIDTHLDSYCRYFLNNLHIQDKEAKKHEKFYDEYLAVLDVTAEFFLQTIDRVFIKNQFKDNCFQYKDQILDLKAIDGISLLTIESELDDIVGFGQTHAAVDLLTNLDASRKKSYTLMGAGHYGVFSGRRCKANVVPVICDFINNN